MTNGDASARINIAPEAAARLASFGRLGGGALIVLGVVAAIVGIIVLVVPEKTLWLVAILFGIYFIISGIVRVVTSFLAGQISVGLRIFVAILGLILVAAGIYILFNPAVGVVTIGLLIGISWIVEGVGQLAAIRSDAPKGLVITLGILTIIAGIVILFVPVTAAIVFTIVSAIILVVLGIASIVGGVLFTRSASSATAAVSA